MCCLGDGAQYCSLAFRPLLNVTEELKIEVHPIKTVNGTFLVSKLLCVPVSLLPS